MDSKKNRQVKKSLNVEENRRSRSNAVIAIRKDKKEESIMKRRNMASVIEEPVAEQQSAPASGKTPPPTLAELPNLKIQLESHDIPTQLNALKGFRRLLSVDKNPPVQQCIQLGVIPMFVNFLQRNDSNELQFEAAWALTNIASTDKTKLVVDYGAVPHLVQLLHSPIAEVREQAGWCLGNVAGDCAALRDIVLQAGALQPLIANLMQPASVALMRNLTWTLSNLCRGKPQPALEIISPALPALNVLISQCGDAETITDAVWALSYISDGDNNRIQAVVDLGVVPTLVQMLQSSKSSDIVPALRTLGNIVSGNDTQTQAVLNAGVLNIVAPLLSHSKKNIRKETCWMLSNIAAGNFTQLSQLVTYDLLSLVLKQLSSAAEWDVRKEAAWVVSNIATGGKPAQINQLVEAGAIGPLSELLESGESKILMIALEAVEAIMKAGQKLNLDSKYASLIEESGGLDRIEALQEHENEEIYKKSVTIIENFFGGEEEAEEEEDEEVAPSQQQNQFQFTNENSLPLPPQQSSFGFPPVPPKSVSGFGFPQQQQQQQTQQMFQF